MCVKHLNEGKSDLRVFAQVLVPDGIVLSISETAHLLGFSCTTGSRLYTKKVWGENQTSSERQFYGLED